MIKECAGTERGVLWAEKEEWRGREHRDDSPHGVPMVVSLPNWIGIAAVCVRVLRSRRFRAGYCWTIPLFMALTVSGPVPAGEGKPSQRERNPHGDPTLCDACHMPRAEGRRALRFEGNVSRLCQSCHEGRRAKREVHPVDVAPSEAIRRQMPSDFPLADGKMTCLTCHDLAWGCTMESPAGMLNRCSLRGNRVANPLAFCLGCHAKASYSSFNVHDQLEAGKPKADACRWCHISVPDTNSPGDAQAPHGLRDPSGGMCRNCHRMMEDHPTGSPHVGTAPSSEMVWRMSAYEMQSTMRLPFARLLEYARVARRSPRSMPLNENGRIACYTCHNPHETGLMSLRNPASVGSEPKHAANHRLRIHEGKICVACHPK
jgi:hypothetical protein